MSTGEGPLLAEPLDVSVEKQHVIRKLGLALLGMDEQGVDTTPDVEGGVVASVTGAVAQLVERLLWSAKWDASASTSPTRSRNVKRRNSGPPTVRAYSTVWAKSIPSLETTTTAHRCWRRE